MSGLFEARWYTSCYADVGDAAGVEALDHYVLHGAAEGRNPSPIFDTAYYLSQFPALDPRKVNPLCHYILFGEKAGAWPNPWFDPVHVDAVLPAEKRNGSLLSAYNALGPTLINPSASFDAGAYLSERPLLRAAGINPLWHYACTRRGDLTPPPVAAPELSYVAGQHLESIGVMDGRNLYHVTGGDPYMIFQKADGALIGPGHYRLEFAFSGPDDALGRAKIYIDYGDDFSEASTRPLLFEKGPAGIASAVVSLELPAARLRFDPLDNPHDPAVVIGLGPVTLRPVGKVSHYTSLAARLAPGPLGRASLGISLGLTALHKGPSAAAAKLRALDRKHCDRLLPLTPAQAKYRAWLEKYDTVTAQDRKAMAAMIQTFAHRPLISIIMPVYNTPEDLLCECIDSVLDQTYPDWELCIADDKSPEPHIRAILERYMSRDPRIKAVFRSENGHISKASNSALDLASGEWIALLDHDDLLPPHALFCVAETINRRPDAMMIYSDEDKVDIAGNRMEPYHKSDWNYHLFLSHNMFSHFGVYRTQLVRDVEGFRPGFEGAQDYDLALRCLERVARSQIIHIPHVLYNWRVIPGSTAMSSDEKPYAMIAGERAICAHFDRMGIPATSELKGHGYETHLKAPDTEPSVAIIIPSRDGGDVLHRCLDSIEKLTSYKNYRLVLVDNGSQQRDTLSLFQSKRGDPRVSYIRDDRPFNFSQLNNDAARTIDSDILVFLNDDIEIHDSDWVTQLVSHAARPAIGAVGARLWYPDGLLQHGGLVLSQEHIAINIHKGMARNHFGYFGRGVLMQELSAVTAACLAVRREVFSQVGGFDAANLGVAYNDVDLCLKIQAAGYVNLLLPSVNLTHHESATRGSDLAAPGKRARLEREKAFMRKKWGSLLDHDPCYNPNLSTSTHDFDLAAPPRVPFPWKRGELS